jgi:hypothetical protein
MCRSQGRRGGFLILTLVSKCKMQDPSPFEEGVKYSLFSMNDMS